MTRILVTNDDGIRAPGLAALVEVLSGLGEIYVVAPERPSSAAAARITLHKPIRADHVEYPGATAAWAASGFPVDCVKLAVHHLLDKDLDLVASGINRGPNVGTNVLYSGTVAGALEGALAGISSVAFSVNDYHCEEFAPAADYAGRFVSEVLHRGLPEGVFLNVNFPSGTPRGVRTAPHSTAGFHERYEERADPRGRPYYWLAGEFPMQGLSEDTDAGALAAGWVTVTPLRVTWTQDSQLGEMEDWLPAP